MIPRFEGKRLLERIAVAHGAVNAPVRWRVFIAGQTRQRSPGLDRPKLGVGDKKALVAAES